MGSVACLKTTFTNNSKGQNIRRFGLDSQYAEGFLVYMPSEVHSRMAILLNLVKSCNYYHHRIYVSTRVTEICSRDIVSSRGGIFCSYFAKIYLYNILFAQVEKINIIYFEYRYTLQIYWKIRHVLIHVFDSPARQYKLFVVLQYRETLFVALIKMSEYK